MQKLILISAAQSVASVEDDMLHCINGFLMLHAKRHVRHSLMLKVKLLKFFGIFQQCYCMRLVLNPILLRVSEATNAFIFSITVQEAE